MRKNPGQRIREKRLRAGLTLRTLAGDVGISFSYLRDLEHGTRRLLPELGRRLAAACISRKTT